MTPRLALYAFGVVVCVIALIAVLSFLSDPFGRKARKIERLEQEASARTAESAGLTEQAQRTESYHREIITIQSATASAVTEARSATDADTPLDLERADRLRRADDRLCVLTACSAASPDNPAG